LLALLAVVLVLAIYSGSILSFLGSRPFGVLWLICGAALASLWRRRQERRRRLVVLTVAFTLLTLWCLPVCSFLACRWLETRHPRLLRRPADAQAVVVLGGALRKPEVHGSPFQLAEVTVYRCLRAGEIYRQGAPCKIVVSGGKVAPEGDEPALSEAMRAFLIREGVPADDVIEENSSRSTRENAVETSRILRTLGIRKVVLVTDGLHMTRALRCFEEQGIEVVACGCSYTAVEFEWSVREFLPSPTSALHMRRALHEYVGLVWYSLNGWI
jgi:uncharacterized SAM-binding protein YcdF (DUF218 family)